MTLRQTPLHDIHVAAGARMVDFAGWDMPLHYGSQLEEHRRVREAAGMFDVSHMLAIDVSGPDASPFLRRVLANDVSKLTAVGKALYSCMLNENGGVIDDVIVYAQAAGGYRVVVNAGTAESDLDWMSRNKAAADVEIRPRRDLALIAVQGPQARSKMWQAAPEWRTQSEPLAQFEGTSVGESFIARTGYTGEDGFEIMLPGERAEALWRALESAGVAPAGLAARDTLRLEAGMNLYGQDMDERVTPFECGLAWTVDLHSAREFVGRDALERSARSSKRAGLVLEDRGVMRNHQRVRTPSGDGETTSGGFSPTMNRSIALARVPSDVTPGADVEVDVRGKWLRARVVDPPFVRNGRVRVHV